MDSVRPRLESFLRAHFGLPDLRLGELEPIPEGHSGFTYFVSTADNGSLHRRWVLRIPPPGARAAGPADVVRQGRIMSALHRAGLPVPAIPVLGEDPAILDGRPFVLMELVEGLRIEPTLTRITPSQVCASAIEVLRRIQSLPIELTGLADEEPVGLDAEMIRWSWLMQRAPQELTGAAPRLGELLVRRRPIERAPVLVHGDYHFGNMLFRGSELVAVLDWEIAQLGQPLIDLGCLWVVAQGGRFEDAPRPGGDLELDLEEVVAMYGADPAEFRWYMALSCYKYASIFGYNLMLHRRGKRPDPMYEGLTDTIRALIEQGIQVLGASSRTYVNGLRTGHSRSGVAPEPTDQTEEH